jgi:hypothetical protein
VGSARWPAESLPGRAAPVARSGGTRCSPGLPRAGHTVSPTNRTDWPWLRPSPPRDAHAAASTTTGLALRPQPAAATPRRESRAASWGRPRPAAAAGQGSSRHLPEGTAAGPPAAPRGPVAAARPSVTVTVAHRWCRCPHTGSRPCPADTLWSPPHTMGTRYPCCTLQGTTAQSCPLRPGAPPAVRRIRPTPSASPSAPASVWARPAEGAPARLRGPAAAAGRLAPSSPD